jgi:hypothetical protein
MLHEKNTVWQPISCLLLLLLLLQAAKQNQQLLKEIAQQAEVIQRLEHSNFVLHQRLAATIKQLRQLRAAGQLGDVQLAKVQLAKVLEDFALSNYKSGNTWNASARLAVTELRAVTGLSNKKLAPVLVAVFQYLTGRKPSKPLMPAASTTTKILKQVTDIIRSRVASSSALVPFCLYCDAATLHAQHLLAVMLSYFDIAAGQPRQVLVDSVPVLSSSAPDQAAAIKKVLAESTQIKDLLRLYSMVSDNTASQDALAAVLEAQFNEQLEQYRQQQDQQQQQQQQSGGPLPAGQQQQSGGPLPARQQQQQPGELLLPAGQQQQQQPGQLLLPVGQQQQQSGELLPAGQQQQQPGQLLPAVQPAVHPTSHSASPVLPARTSRPSPRQAVPTQAATPASSTAAAPPQWLEELLAWRAMAEVEHQQLLRAPCSHHVLHLAQMAWFETFCGKLPTGRDAWKAKPLHLFELAWLVHRVVYGSSSSDKQAVNRHSETAVFKDLGYDGRPQLVHPVITRWNCIVTACALLLAAWEPLRARYKEEKQHYSKTGKQVSEMWRVIGPGLESPRLRLQAAVVAASAGLFYDDAFQFASSADGQERLLPAGVAAQCTTGDSSSSSSSGSDNSRMTRLPPGFTAHLMPTQVMQWLRTVEVLSQPSTAWDAFHVPLLQELNLMRASGMQYARYGQLLPKLVLKAADGFAVAAQRLRKWLLRWLTLPLSLCSLPTALGPHMLRAFLTVHCGIDLRQPCVVEAVAAAVLQPSTASQGAPRSLRRVAADAAAPVAVDADAAGGNLHDAVFVSGVTDAAAAAAAAATGSQQQQQRAANEGTVILIDCDEREAAASDAHQQQQQQQQMGRRLQLLSLLRQQQQGTSLASSAVLIDCDEDEAAAAADFTTSSSSSSYSSSIRQYSSQGISPACRSWLLVH